MGKSDGMLGAYNFTDRGFDVPGTRSLAPPRAVASA